MTNLLPVEPTGVQSPRVRVAPRHKWSELDDAAFLATAYGLEPDEWQGTVLSDWLGRQADGKWSSLTCGLSVPRQNGKNAVLEMRELFGMISLGEKFLHTAHEVKTARKAFLRIASFFENERHFPELAALVSDIRRTNGQEAVMLANGGSVEFVARSKGSGRGFTVDVLVMDEAQEMGDESLEALMPTTSAAPTGNPQWIFTGTPPGPMHNGEVFQRVRAEAMSGKSGRACWHEWSADLTDDPDDHNAWRKANPALGIRLQSDVCEGERARFSEAGFMRERLGIWEGSDQRRTIIPWDSWKLAADELSMPADRYALGIEVGADMARASVALAGQRADGLWHIELDERRDGAAWVVPYVAALRDANPQIRTIVVDAGSPAGAILQDFKNAGVRVYTPRVGELGQACSRLLDGVMSLSLRHTGQPQLTEAVMGAGRRTLGDTGMWVWSRMHSTSDVTPIQAATWALLGAQRDRTTSPGRPARAKTSGRMAVVL